MTGFSDDLIEMMKRPVGTLTLRYTSDQLFDDSVAGGKIFDFATGAIVFRLLREEDLALRFFHASPGTGTRVAEVNLNELPPSPRVFVALTWSPDEIRLHVGDEVGNLASGVGRQAETTLQVGADGAIYEIGSPGLEVFGARITEGDREVLAPTALQVWEETKRAVEIHLRGTSEEGYAFEVVQANLAIVMLNTGFEAYCEARFRELMNEGVTIELVDLAEKFLSSKERSALDLEAERSDRPDELFELIHKRVDFGNYDDCKKAFREAYGIRFGIDLQVTNQLLDEIQRFIKYRHRIVHVSPLLALLNRKALAREAAEFANRSTAERALAAFDEFIQAMHAASLRLSRKD